MTSKNPAGEEDASGEPAKALVTTPFRLDLDYVSPSEIVRTVVWERARDLPEWHSTTLECVLDPAALLPADAVVLLRMRGDRSTSLAAAGPEYVLYVEARRSQTSVFVAARHADVAERIIADARAAVPVPAATTTPFKVWRWDGSDARSWQRDLEVPDWADIARNYPGAQVIETLMGLGSLAGTGRIMLWTGPPGTGKTYAIRALARAWRSWCDADLIVDPERFFGDAGYLIEVLTSTDATHDEDAADARPARLIICEDADDFIRARPKSGPGLGRLLNVADGLLGQGLNAVILLTSNTPVERLDPALLRPGRLLANLEFGPFAAPQARAWLGDPGAAVPPDGLTLAELYERAGATTRHLSPAAAPTANGAYL